MKIKYSLYGMKSTTENIDWAQENIRFYRATANYLLAYAQEKPQRSILVQAGQLSMDDLLWLHKCNLDIIQETVDQNEDMRKSMLAFLENLERELAEEKKKLEGGE